MNVLSPTTKGSVMSYRGKRYVKPCTSEELKKLASDDEETKEAVAEDKRGLGELQLFIINESQVGSNTRELVTDRPFSFTLFEDMLRKDRFKREVKLPANTVLSFFADNYDYFIFDEDEHCLSVNLKTGNVNYRQNHVAKHVLDHVPASGKQLT